MISTDFNASERVLGSVLTVVVLGIGPRAAYHIGGKKPNRVLKRVTEKLSIDCILKRNLKKISKTSSK